MLLRIMTTAAFLLLVAIPCARAQEEPPPPEPAPAPAPTEAAPEPAPTATEAAPAPAEPAPEKESFWRRVWPRSDDTATPPPGATATAAAGEPVAAAAAAPAGPPRRLAGVQERLRATRVGTDLTGMRFLDLVDSGAATAAQLNDFGVWLAGQGILEPAEQYFRASLDLDRANPNVWNNLGMVQQRLGEDGAKSSFKHAIDLDVTHAQAHYNLGMLLDAEGDYDAAIEQYIRALTLDPRLGDPVHNPQVVNNPRLLVVRMGLYERKAKTLGLSMNPAAPKK